MPDSSDRPYFTDTQRLAGRIEKLIPANPRILSIKNPFELMDIEGFVFDDIKPSVSQVLVALRLAITRYHNQPHQGEY